MSRAIFRSTSIVGSITLLSRITGLVREMVYAQTFGAGPLMDAFLVAFKIPNFLRRLFAEGAFAQSFVPVLSEYRHKRSPEDVRELVSGAVGTLGGILFVVTLIGVIAAPVLVLTFASGFLTTEGQYEQAAAMLRLTFPYVLFVSLTALFSAVLNSYGRFAVPAFTHVLMNIVMILFTAWLAAGSRNPGLVLAGGVFVSGVVQLLFQLPSIARLRLLSWPRWRPGLEGVRSIGKRMLPGVFGSSVAQISLLIDTQIASFLMEGSIAWLYFADRLMEFPLGVFGIALGTVILPGLSAHYAKASQQRFDETLDWALRLTLLLATPAAVALCVLAGPITATVFGRGAFGERDVIMTSHALMAYSGGMLGMSLVKVLAPGYFARQDMRTPVKVGLIALGINIALNLLVVVPAWLLGFPTPHVLLAASTSVSAIANTWLLWRGLRQQGAYEPLAGWPMLLMRVILANVTMASVLWWLAGDAREWVDAPTLERIYRCATCILAGAGTYFGTLLLLGARYADLAGRRLARL